MKTDMISIYVDHGTKLEFTQVCEKIGLRNVHKINSTTKPDLAGQNQVWTLLFTCQVLF
jgi:hypothetical protein